LPSILGSLPSRDRFFLKSRNLICVSTDSVKPGFLFQDKLGRNQGRDDSIDPGPPLDLFDSRIDDALGLGLVPEVSEDPKRGTLS
jgi:hypothetical protein